MRSPPTLSRAFPPYSERQRQAQLSEVTSFGKDHGRIEHRHLQASTRLAGHFDWPGLQQVCKIHRVTHRDGKRCEETQHAVTSVPRACADAATLLDWWRGHWGIENRLFWVRDVTLGEDASRVRTGHAPQILAGIRNAAISFLRRTGVTNIAARLRHFAYRVDDLLAALGIVKK